MELENYTLDEKEIVMEIKPLAGLTNILRTFLKLNIIITVLLLASVCYDYHFYKGLTIDEYPDGESAFYDLASGLIYISKVILMLLVGITFLRWTYRTNKNLHILSGQEMEFTPDWAVGWHFIPLACLFKPYQAMKEIWHVSHKDNSISHSIVSCWWLFWIISTFFGMLRDDSESYVSKEDMISAVLSLALNIVLLILVTRIASAYSKNIIEQNVEPTDESVLSLHSQ